MNIHERLANILGTDVAALALSCGMVALVASNSREVLMKFANEADLKKFQTCHALQRVPLFNGTTRTGVAGFLPCRIPEIDKQNVVLDDRYTADDMIYVLRQHGYTDIQSGAPDTTNGTTMLTCRNDKKVPVRFILE